MAHLRIVLFMMYCISVLKFPSCLQESGDPIMALVPRCSQNNIIVNCCWGLTHIPCLTVSHHVYKNVFRREEPFRIIWVIIMVACGIPFSGIKSTPRFQRNGLKLDGLLPVLGIFAEDI